MARKVAVKEKKLYRSLREEGLSKKKAQRVTGALMEKPRKTKPKSGRAITKPVAALTNKVKKLRPHHH